MKKFIYVTVGAIAFGGLVALALIIYGAFSEKQDQKITQGLALDKGPTFEAEIHLASLVVSASPSFPQKF